MADFIEQLDPVSRALVWTDLRGRYVNGSAQYVTQNRGLLGGEILLGDGTTGSTFPSLGSPPKGMVFDGSSDYLTIPDNSRLSFGDGHGGDYPFSLSVFGSISLGGPTLLAKGTFNTTNEYAVYTGTDYLYFALIDYGGLYADRLAVRTTYAYPPGGDESFICTYDGSKATTGMAIYYGGRSMDLTVTSAGTYRGMGPRGAGITVCNYPGIGGVFMPGTLLDVRVYPFALTPTQAAYLAQLQHQQRWV